MYIPDFDPDLDADAPMMRVPLLPQTKASQPLYDIEARETPVSFARTPNLQFSTLAFAGVGIREGLVWADSTLHQVMEPQIYTVAADGTHISAPAAMSDIHDNAAMNIDFEGLANQATKTVTGKSVEEQVGTVKQVWNGFLDDLFGPKASKA